MDKDCAFPYIHGFSPEEQQRLVRQAEYTEFVIYQDVDFSGVKELVEVGCGVGAQTSILLRRFPHAHVTGLDLSQKQIDAAQAFLDQQNMFQDRFNLKVASAEQTNLQDHQYEGAFICWLLEHVKDPHKVLMELKRILRPQSPVVITEVMNSSFFLDPYSPNMWKYWMAFNDFQLDQAGDPFVGAKLGNLLLKAGYSDIETRIKTIHLDNRNPAKRRSVLKDWKALLLSAADELLQAKYVDEELVKGTEKEFDDVIQHPDAIIYYSFMQAHARS